MGNATKKRAAIVGAGPVGCVAAEVLARVGFQVDLYEKRPAPAQAAGRSINLSISPRGMRVLDRFGVGPIVRAESVRMEARAFHFQPSDVSIQPYGDPGWVTYSIARAELNRILLALALCRPEVRIHRGYSCLHADLERPELTMRDPDGSVKTFEADLIVGADGAASVVRFGLLRAPRANFAKIVFQGGYRELTLREPQTGSTFYRNAIHIWARGDFFMVALPNCDGTLRATLVLPDDRTRELGQAQAWTAFFKDHFPDVIPHLAETAEELIQRPLGEIVSIRCDTLHHSGTALLLGDAAHALVPFMGQGVNLGLEDCAALADLLEEHGTDLERVFPAMTERRSAEALACADLSEWNFKELASGHPVPAGRNGHSLVSQVNFSGLSYRNVAEQTIPNWSPRVIAGAR